MIAALLLLLLQPGATGPDDQQWLCTANARGKYGARVDIDIQLTGAGEILTRDTRWSPRKASHAIVSRPDLDAPDLTLHYGYAGAEGIGEVTEALGNVSSIDAPAGTFDQMIMGLRIDPGETWYVELNSIEPESQYPIADAKAGGSGLDFRSATLSSSNTDADQLESFRTARLATLSLVDLEGRPVSQTSYDLSAIAERDRLFAKAWKKAGRLALHPQRCTRIPGE
jgi:hypothetical protein